MPLGIGKINDDILSAADTNCSVGFESVLRRVTEGMSESTSNTAPLFRKNLAEKAKVDHPVRRIEFYLDAPRAKSTKESKRRSLPLTVFCTSKAAKLESVCINW